MSSPSGCTNVTTYVPPAQEIKSSKLIQTSSTKLKQLEGYIVTRCNMQTSLTEQPCKHIDVILLYVNLL